jgi:hypothetical protein
MGKTLRLVVLDSGLVPEPPLDITETVSTLAKDPGETTVGTAMVDQWTPKKKENEIKEKNAKI